MILDLAREKGFQNVALSFKEGNAGVVTACFDAEGQKMNVHVITFRCTRDNPRSFPRCRNAAIFCSLPQRV
jgi:hypothetical protein